MWSIQYPALCTQYCALGTAHSVPSRPPLHCPDIWLQRTAPACTSPRGSLEKSQQSSKDPRRHQRSALCECAHHAGDSCLVLQHPTRHSWPCLAWCLCVSQTVQSDFARFPQSIESHAKIVAFRSRESAFVSPSGPFLICIHQRHPQFLIVVTFGPTSLGTTPYSVLGFRARCSVLAPPPDPGYFC
jgi:hypothetical protein